jgi:hypothetical protein
MGEFGPLVTLRVALGSGLAFLSAQLLDITVFNRLRRAAWWKCAVGLAAGVVHRWIPRSSFTIAFSAALDLARTGQ